MWEVKVSLELSDGHTQIVTAKADRLILLYYALEMLPVRYSILSGERKPILKQGGCI
jgi:hypothetical protein